MQFARADTYINVYLPRPDGEDPRRFASPASPVFNSNRTYKFSDQIVKDRPLFLGRKQMSLYEIYYKDNKDGGPETAAETPVEKAEEENSMDKLERLIEPGLEKSETFIELPNVKKLSLSLDSRSKKSAKRRIRSTRRFNEPLNSYVSNRKKVQAINNYNPTETIERQLTTIEILGRKSEHEHQTKIRTLQRLIKKTQSAPADLKRSPRSVGLPPIIIGNTLQSTMTASPPSSKVTYNLYRKAMPVRPSSKPHTIWRQTSEMMTDRNTPRLMDVDRYVNNQSQNVRVGIYN